jgi:hypothetical protein
MLDQLGQLGHAWLGHLGTFGLDGAVGHADRRKPEGWARRGRSARLVRNWMPSRRPRILHWWFVNWPFSEDPISLGPFVRVAMACLNYQVRAELDRVVEHVAGHSSAFPVRV